MAVSNIPRIIVLRTDTTQVFSGDFNGQSTTQPANSSTAPALQLTYSAPYSGLEVYSFNASALSSDVGVSWSVGTPEQQQQAQSQELCNALVQQNPGERLQNFDPLNPQTAPPPPSFPPDTAHPRTRVARSVLRRSAIISSERCAQVSLCASQT